MLYVLTHKKARPLLVFKLNSLVLSNIDLKYHLYIRSYSILIVTIDFIISVFYQYEYTFNF